MLSAGQPPALAMAITSKDVPYLLKKLAKHTGKAAWIFTTTVLVLIIPLIVELDREQTMIDMEKGQMDVLTQPGAAKAV